MIKTIRNWLEWSRVFSSPMTILSWFVIFVWSFLCGGNVFYGILALVGVCFAHLATNLVDDYVDYKKLCADANFDISVLLTNKQKSKCRYLASGEASLNDVLLVIGLYLGVAGIIGIILAIFSTPKVLLFGIVGGLIVLSYPYLSRLRLSEVAVGLAYGPALFGGVYTAMTGHFEWESLFLSVPTMLLTVGLLYTHTMLDYEFDKKENKTTLCTSFKTQADGLRFLDGLMICAYLSVFVMCVFDIFDWQVLLTYLTIPLALDLHRLMKIFINKEPLPNRRWYHFPMENWREIEATKTEEFMMRMYCSRNLMVYFSFMFVVGMILSEIE